MTQAERQWRERERARWGGEQMGPVCLHLLGTAGRGLFARPAVRGGRPSYTEATDTPTHPPSPTSPASPPLTNCDKKTIQLAEGKAHKRCLPTSHLLEVDRRVEGRMEGVRHRKRQRERDRETERHTQIER